MDLSTFTVIDTLTSTSGTYAYHEIPLSSYSGNGNRIVLKAPKPASGNNRGHVDDIVLGSDLCATPSNLTVNASDVSSVTLQWTENGTATLWEIEYGPVGFTSGSGTSVTATANPFDVTGLNPATTYEFQVRADCGGGYSEWSLTRVTGTTTCVPLTTIPFSENFDSYTTVSVGETGAQPDYWEVITEDVTLTKATKPQVYYGYAISGNYTLRMKNRCVYAMPALENINVRGMTMTFSLRQPNSKYRLQVGVVNDEGEFMLVKTLKCSSTSNMEAKTVDFSNYTGNGNRIAFRNTLVPGTGSSTSYLDYSINYIEDINLNYTVAAKNVANDGNVMGMNAALENIEVYPNPTKDYVNVECTTNNVQCSGIEVVDVYGKVVRTVVGANNYSPTQINVSGLAAGMYFVRVTTDRGAVTKPFVKR